MNSIEISRLIRYDAGLSIEHGLRLDRGCGKGRVGYKGRCVPARMALGVAGTVLGAAYFGGTKRGRKQVRSAVKYGQSKIRQGRDKVTNYAKRKAEETIESGKKYVASKAMEALRFGKEAAINAGKKELDRRVQSTVKTIKEAPGKAWDYTKRKASEAKEYIKKQVQRAKETLGRVGRQIKESRPVRYVSNKVEQSKEYLTQRRASEKS